VIVLAVLLVPVLGILGATAIYGMRKYVTAAKTVEAKNGVTAIARFAVAAYERDHRLCASAEPVPSSVPRGVKYAPSTAAGADFHAGDATKGWPCLKFSMEAPMYYQYAYETGAGSGKSGATASGFEASARGDLDGNGVTSFFARGGDVRDGHVVLRPDLYIENEME